MATAVGRELPVCLLCRVSVKAKDRRKIHSATTGHVIPVLNEFVSELGLLSTDPVIHANAFLCRPCLRSVENLIKLREDVKKKEAELRQQMDKVREAYRLQRVNTTEYQAEQQPHHRTPDKRPADVAGLETPTFTTKQRRYNTPIRKTLQTMIPAGSSPAVAVSSTVVCSNIVYRGKVDVDSMFLPVGACERKGKGKGTHDPKVVWSQEACERCCEEKSQDSCTTGNDGYKSETTCPEYLDT